MKVFVGAAIALAVCATSALAQTTTTTTPSAPETASVAPPPSHCGDLTPAPQFDLTHATPERVRDANQAMLAWAAESRTRLQCRGAEVQLLVAQTRAAQSAYNDQVTQFTNAANAWNAQTEALRTRGAENRHAVGSVH